MKNIGERRMRKRELIYRLFKRVEVTRENISQSYGGAESLDWEMEIGRDGLNGDVWES